MIESFNLENAINDAVEIEDYENDINVAEEMLVKKYADEVAKKNEEELKKEKRRHTDPNVCGAQRRRATYLRHAESVRRNDH